VNAGHGVAIAKCAKSTAAVLLINAGHFSAASRDRPVPRLWVRYDGNVSEGNAAIRSLDGKAKGGRKLKVNEARPKR
jgi:hypothetical protein